MNILLGIILFIFICGIVLLLIGIIDANRYVKTTNEFLLPNIKKNFKFVYFSDLHNHVFGKNNEKLINDIINENPDFIIIGGDLITSHANESYEPGIHFLTELSKHFTIYYGMGNHETRIDVDRTRLPGKYEELMNGVSDKCVVLKNESVYLEQYNLEITGLEIERFFFRRFNKFILPIMNMNRYVGQRNEEHASILIAHNPQFFDTYCEWKADLVLSGHNHGGIMKLPFLGGVIAPTLELFPKFDGGEFKKDNTTMLLSRGLGCHSIKLRFFNPGEFHVITCLKE